MSILVSRVIDTVKKYEQEVINIRHRIHQNPELAFNEIETAELVAEKLTDLKLKVLTNVYETGVCGLLETSKQGKTILLRADMDALPIQEKTGLKYQSQNPGIMHACGHDAHTAILLGTAMVLNDLKADLKGNIKFVFQPAEEAEGGALGMIKAGVLKNPDVDAALGLHVWGTVPKGIIEYKSGPLMASPDRFVIRIIGKGGHAAQPQNCIDPIPITSQVINEFQQIISRRIDPVESAVISVCHIEGGKTHNVIPDEVMMEGTVRSLIPEVRKQLPEMMESVVEKISSIYGGGYEFDFYPHFPPLINDDAMTDLLKKSAGKIVGADRLHRAEKPNMGGEDFSYFAREVPACFFYLGIAPSAEIIKHHQPKFNVDDTILKDGVAVLTQAVIDYLNG